MPAQLKHSGVDQLAMMRAISLARRGASSVRPNPMVGSVLLHDEHVVGEGWHQRAGSDHAEVLAIRDAGENAAGATLYVTLEPCNHHGKTPPCTDAIVEAGVVRVVVAMRDPNPSVEGGGIERLRAEGLQVDVGVCESVATEILAPWTKRVRTGRPFVTLKLAVSRDEKIARADGDSKWISSAVSRAQVHRLRSACDAVLVGEKTVVVDNPLLTNRSGRGAQPLRVVVDSQLRSDPAFDVYQPQAEHEGQVVPTTLAATTEAADAARVEVFEQAGIEVAVLPSSDRGVDLKALLDVLGDHGVEHVLCEGGAALGTSLVEQSLADRVILYRCPIELGNDGLDFLNGGMDLLNKHYELYQEDQIGPDKRLLFQPRQIAKQ